MNPNEPFMTIDNVLCPKCGIVDGVIPSHYADPEQPLATPCCGFCPKCGTQICWDHTKLYLSRFEPGGKKLEANEDGTITIKITPEE